MIGVVAPQRPVVLAAIVVLTLLILSASGCIERKEKIAIDADGTVRMRLEFATDSFDELYTGDAIPAVEDGWLVEESIDRDDEGKETFRLVADAIFRPEETLPGSYAGRRVDEEDLSLRFPTKVVIETRRDGIYYHFSRTYDARPWAYLDKARTLLKEHMDGLEGREFKDLSLPERAALIRFVAKYETMRYRVFAREAFREAVPDAPQDLWLRVHAALVESARTLDVERLLELVVDEDDELRDEALNSEMETFQKTALEAMERALRKPGGGGGGANVGADIGAVNAFSRRFRRHMEYYGITDELGDDQFTIEVALPGEIMGHNGDEANGPTVTWKFTGLMLRDRELELMATSRVQLDAP